MCVYHFFKINYSTYSFYVGRKDGTRGPKGQELGFGCEPTAINLFKDGKGRPTRGFLVLWSNTRKYESNRKKKGFEQEKLKSCINVPLVDQGRCYTTYNNMCLSNFPLNSLCPLLNGVLPSFYSRLHLILTLQLQGGEFTLDTCLIPSLGEVQGVLQAIRALFKRYFLHKCDCPNGAVHLMQG